MFFFLCFLAHSKFHFFSVFLFLFSVFFCFRDEVQCRFFCRGRTDPVSWPNVGVPEFEESNPRRSRTQSEPSQLRMAVVYAVLRES